MKISRSALRGQQQGTAGGYSSPSHPMTSSPPTVPIPHPSVLTSTLVPGVSDRIKAFLNKMKESLDCVESMNPRDTFDAVRIWNATSEKLQEYLKRAERQLAEMEAPLTYASPSASIMWSATSNATAMKSDQNSSLPPPPITAQEERRRGLIIQHPEPPEIHPSMDSTIFSTLLPPEPISVLKFSHLLHLLMSQDLEPPGQSLREGPSTTSEDFDPLHHEGGPAPGGESHPQLHHTHTPTTDPHQHHHSSQQPTAYAPATFATRATPTGTAHVYEHHHAPSSAMQEAEQSPAGYSDHRLVSQRAADAFSTAHHHLGNPNQEHPSPSAAQEQKLYEMSTLVADAASRGSTNAPGSASVSSGDVPELHLISQAMPVNVISRTPAQGILSTPPTSGTEADRQGSTGDRFGYDSEDDSWRSPSESQSNDQDNAQESTGQKKATSSKSGQENRDPVVPNEEVLNQMFTVKINAKGCKSYECIICHAKNHIQAQECEQCKKKFSSVKAYRAHLRLIHRKPVVIPCKICSKVFSTSANLQRHISSIHSNYRPYSCNICGASFVERRTLAEHVTTHTGNKPFVCKHCNERFSQKSSLRAHIEIHLMSKQHLCPTCGKSFRQATQLATHISRSHATSVTDKKYLCSHCPAKFGVKADFHRHLRQHSESPAFVCDICRKGFTRRQGLQEHMNIHLGVKPFQCPVCSKRINPSTVETGREWESTCKEGIFESGRKKEEPQ
ncbi:unnamed protein product [Cyprideis torosa]|uniref:Uncharacterized protein n=1 Tax=Cyprideis torosa TaxID=163714 RepID=A0A7R8ZT88_9CRUS|nr:unnamed protein product [Cyprideis torosa]CAG0897464.1 unnamed protein product [Cyprideis torosa]